MREGEERYRDMFLNLNVMVILHDLEGNIIQVNDEVLKVFGYSKPELHALNIKDLLSESSHDWSQKIIKTCMNNGSTRQEAVFRKKSQDTFPAYVYANPLTIDNKKLIQCVVHNITEYRPAEESFELSVESAPNSIIMVDQDGVIKLVNSETEKTFRYTRKELIGQSVEILVPKRYRTGHHEHRRGFLTDPQKRQIGVGRNLFAMRKDGREFPAEIALNPVHTKDGLMVLCSIVDVTERKRLEERMIIRDRAFMSVTNGILITDAREPHNPIIHCNPAFEKITGYSRDEIIGRNCRFLHNDDRDQEGIRELRKAIEEGRECSVLLRNYRKDGTMFWNELSISPSSDESGRLTHFVGVINDVTDRKASEELLKKSHDELEHRVRARTAEITNSNEKLRHEIAEHQQARQGLENALSEISKLRDQLEKENIYLQEEIRSENSYGEMIGESKVMQSLLSQVEQVATAGSTVLLTGETGTGKELLAHAIHKLSARNDRLMVKMNCAALPENLVESELFGYEKGAFTGADRRKIGRFEVANGSTIFLDEIGDVSLEIQPKLLRVLEEGVFYRLGNSKEIKVDVRIIAATNRDLAKAVKHGWFREDLYYRLNVFSIDVAPLRERTEDIPLLVEAFVREFSEKNGKNIEEIPKRTMTMLQRYPWPGNVRELRNVVEKAMILNMGPKLHISLPEIEDLSRESRNELKLIEKEHILAVLEMTHWRVRGRGGAAEILGLKPTTLEYTMHKLGINRKA